MYKLTFLAVILCAGCTLSSHEIASPTTTQFKAVVFDIDGTLTTRSHAIHTVRKGAVDAVALYADNGHKIIYLTARTPVFQWHVPEWLSKHGFPAGSIHVTESREDREDFAKFKQGVLETYLARGWTLVAAYGDSSTDFKAYSNAGLDRSRIFALGAEGTTVCEPGVWTACFDNWPDQMAKIEELIRSED
jgi:phosphoserine phosphatase